MKPNNAKEAFESFVSRAGTTIAALTPDQALRMMCDFYQQRKADGCQETDGDTLVYQWTTDDSDHGRTFQFEIARQFIESGDEDEDGMSEISLTSYFQPSPELEALGTGEQRCSSRERVTGFQDDVTSSAAFRAVGKLKPQHVALEYINV